MALMGEPRPADREPPWSGSLDGRVLRAIRSVEGGSVSSETEFVFEQRGEVVSGRDSGGGVALGFLVASS